LSDPASQYRAVGASAQTKAEATQLIVEVDDIVALDIELEAGNGLGVQFHSDFPGSAGEANRCFPVNIPDCVT
jgi:hypothetical protein